MNYEEFFSKNMHIGFIKESNTIEGIYRPPLNAEIEEFSRFISLKDMTIDDLVKFVSVYEPTAKLRDCPSVGNVRIGKFRPMPSSAAVGYHLEHMLEQPLEKTPFHTHKNYETLHPFTDGNGRSGRALWAWHMKQVSSEDEMHAMWSRGFLHTWYYQSLEESR